MRSPTKRKISEIDQPYVGCSDKQTKITKHRFDQEVYQIQSIVYKGVSLEQSFQKPIPVLQVSRAELIRKTESNPEIKSDVLKRRFYPF